MLTVCHLNDRAGLEAGEDEKERDAEQHDVQQLLVHILRNKSGCFTRNSYLAEECDGVFDDMTSTRKVTKPTTNAKSQVPNDLIQSSTSLP